MCEAVTTSHRRVHTMLVVGVLALVLVGATWRPPQAQKAGPYQKGVALGLFSADAQWDYAGALDEIVETGATDVELVVPWSMPSMQATSIQPKAGVTPPEETLVRTLRQAHERGLRVMLFPIVRMEVRQPGEWRGKIRFDDAAKADAWWASYREFIGTMARVAQAEHVERLSVGSELLLLEVERARWLGLIGHVRTLYKGRILYSSNWDHFAVVSFWDAVDEVGMTAYFELTKETQPTLPMLLAGWERWMPTVRNFAAAMRKPVLFTEAGYPSQDGTNIHPWDETRRARVDLEEQRLCYRALFQTLAASPGVTGVYLWNWFGHGGVEDGDYTPRGKPAAQEMKVFFQR